MGVYSGNIIVPRLPFTLQKLGLFTWLMTPIENPFTTPFALIVRRDDKTELLSLVIDPPKEPPPKEEGSTRHQVGMAFGIGPIELPEGCKYLAVEAIVDGEVIIGPKLRVKVDKMIIDQMMPDSMKAVMERIERVDSSGEESA